MYFALKNTTFEIFFMYYTFVENNYLLLLSRDAVAQRQKHLTFIICVYMYTVGML